MPTKRTIVQDVYQFSELSPKAKERARDWYREGALEYDWWDATYEDAERSGLKLEGFDLGRSNDIEGKFTRDAVHCAEKILEDHGKETETYKDAKSFLEDRNKIDEDDEEKLEELDNEFLKTILEDYLSILRAESEYLTSDEQVDESIEANEYEFDESGKRI